MKNFKIYLKPSWGLTALAFLLFTACEMEPSIDQSNELASAKKLEIPKNPSLFEFQVNPSFSTKSISANGRTTEIVLNIDTQVRQALYNKLNAIEVTECGDTQFDEWLESEFNQMGEGPYAYAVDYGMFNLPFFYSLLYENNSEGQYFGANGEHTQSLTKTFKDIKRFWNIETSEIELVGMHGSIMTDVEKMKMFYMEIANQPEPNAESMAQDLLFVVQFFPEYENGNNPLFSLNAFALNEITLLGIDIPSKIVMGDGMLEAFTDLGYGDVAPKAILAHEFGHHIQYKLGLFEGPNSPEATRKTELMADAYAAYFLSHARGATMQWKRVQQFLEVFFSIGDCSFEDPGHHGTPLQRMAAAEWGYQLASQTQKQGKIMDPQEFADLFEVVLPELVAP